MVGVFGRSLSFPNKNPNTNRASKPPISHHTRSISLPSRSHPLVSQLKDSVSELQNWSQSGSSPRTSAWLCAGLARLKSVHESLDDILHLPHTLQTLSHHPRLVEKLLEDLLRFVDAYGTFRTSFLALKEEHAAAEAAVRKKDDKMMGSHLRFIGKISTQMRRLTSTIQTAEKKPTASSRLEILIPTVGPDADIIAVILSAVDVTVNVSVALFNGVSASFMPSRRSCSWIRVSGKIGERKEVDEGIEELRDGNIEGLLMMRKGGLRKMNDEEVRMGLRRMQEIMESCIGGIESGSEGVFRSLISTRVSLLNTLTY